MDVAFQEKLEGWMLGDPVDCIEDDERLAVARKDREEMGLSGKQSAHPVFTAAPPPPLEPTASSSSSGSSSYSSREHEDHALVLKDGICSSTHSQNSTNSSASVTAPSSHPSSPRI